MCLWNERSVKAGEAHSLLSQRFALISKAKGECQQLSLTDLMFQSIKILKLSLYKDMRFKMLCSEGHFPNRILSRNLLA